MLKQIQEQSLFCLRPNSLIEKCGVACVRILALLTQDRRSALFVGSHYVYAVMLLKALIVKWRLLNWKLMKD